MHSADRAIEMGFQLSDEKLNAAFVAFKKLQIVKKKLQKMILFVLLTDQQVNSSEVEVYELEELQVQYGKLIFQQLQSL